MHTLLLLPRRNKDEERGLCAEMTVLRMNRKEKKKEGGTLLKE